MKRSPVRFLVAAALVLLSTVQSAELLAGQDPIQLFGVTLKGATRDEFRRALHDGGLVPQREDRNYWFDKYSSKSVVEGTSTLIVEYVRATDEFAAAEYEFPGFVKPKLVLEVGEMIERKYGPPTSGTGTWNVGPVKLVWERDDGMRIVVERGWPNTTTILRYENPEAHARAREELRVSVEAQERAKMRGMDHAL